MAEQQEDTKSDSLSLDWLVSNLRWLWLFLAAVFVLAVNRLGGEPSPYFVELLILVGIGVVLNGVYASLLAAKFFPGWLAVTASVLDILLAVVLLVILSDYGQFLLPIMLIPVVIAGIRWGTEAGLFAALPIVLGYALPLVPVLRGGVDQPQLIAVLLPFGINALTLFLAGALPGPFIRRRVEIAEHANEAELERLRVANERSKIFTEMALTLSSTLDYRKVLKAMIDSAFAAMAEVGTKDESTVAMVLLFEGEEGKLSVASGRNLSRTDQGRRIGSNQGLIGRTISKAETTITHQAQKDKVLTSFASTPGIRSAICAPLRAGFSTYGVFLFCSTEPNLYNQEHKELLTTFSSQAIIALQNAQLFEDIHREQQRILEKEAEARRKLARDLHDGPTQSIAAIVMRLDFIKKVIEAKEIQKAYDEVVKVEEIARHTTQEIRTMLFTMRPVILETQGLAPALNQYAERLNSNESFRVTVINRGYEDQLSPEAEGVAFSIVEEAVGNAKKHAQPSEVRISLVLREESLLVEIRDNGVGFDVARTQSTYDQRTSLGLINMDERAEIVGGQVTLESAPGKGTAVRAELPLAHVVAVK